MPSALFWYGEHGGTAQYRAFTPGRALERLGWDVDYAGEGIDISSHGRLRGDPDVLVIVRAMGALVPDVVRLVRENGRTTVIYDADDWFLRVPGYNPASTLSAEDVDSMHLAMAEAHLITCSTPELVEGYRHLNRTVLLPNYLDPDVWDWNDNRKYRVPHGKISVGWLGAFAWRGGDIESLCSWLPRFLIEHPECDFYSPTSPELLKYLDIPGRTLNPLPLAKPGRNQHLRPYEQLPAILGLMDIGLVPLTFNRFNQSKSWCKGLEYNAMGVPVVASASREYRSFVRPGINGELVRHNNWREKVEQVLADLDNYRDGARKVAAEYMIDDHVHRWVQAYEEARCVSV